MTPGAASATKSKVRASGPMRPEQRHLELQLEVLLQRLLGVHGHAPQVRGQLAWARTTAAALEGVGQVALGVDLAHQGALGRAGPTSSASPAAMLVLPTPPLPVTNSRRWSSRPGCGHRAGGGRRHGQRPSAPGWTDVAARPHRSRSGARCRRHPARCRRSWPTAPRSPCRSCRSATGPGLVGQGRVDALLHLVAVGVGRQLDVDLLDGVGHTDANVHDGSSWGPGGDWRPGVTRDGV